MNEPEAVDSLSRAEEIFLNSLEFNDVEERRNYVRDACHGDSALENDVCKMLDRLPKASAFFASASQDLSVPDSLLPDEKLEKGSEIGPYRIMGVLGEGGSSTVYEAEQTAPVRRQVALKILKLGMDTAAVIGRFEDERQTLAMLEHANISRVFDAGVTEAGRPYFVMELVHGTRITSFCEANHLSVAERLKLVCLVCSALQHAHNKGIIHRDIKPSNILVSNVDGIAVPKLIDFGIAKATNEPSNDGRTIQNQPIGTPAYMSPEQLCGDSRWVDTRSDIYNLGVVLYELLAGQPPFDNDELIQNGIEQMRKRVQAEEPKRPSLAGNRKHLPFRNELDWIVLKALEKDRERRYSTAHAFASDLENYLRNEPVKAHPPSHLYRFEKFIRRNRVATASSAVALLALILGFSVSTVLYLRAHAAEREQTSLRLAAEERAHVAKAAILIMRDKLAEADAEIRLMGGALTQPSLEATNVFRTLAIWSAKNGDWKTSSDRWLAMAQVSRFDDSDMTDKVTLELLPVAPTLVMTCDFNRYHQFQDFLITRLGKTNHPFAAEHLLKLCLLLPAEPALLGRLQHVANVAEHSMPAREAATPPADWMEAWRCVALGLWNYRSGHHDKAIAWCDRSLLRHDWEESRMMQALLIRSMARKAIGAIDEAMTDLDMARDSVKQHFQQPLDEMKDGHFHDWLNAQILLNEAEKTVLEAR